MGSLAATHDPVNRPTRWILRGGLAGVLAYAGIAKALDPAQFALELENYRFLPSMLTPALALYVPWLEIACAGGLLHAAWRRGAWLIALGLCIGFWVFVLSAWMRGLDVTCGCLGGASASPLTGLTVLRTSLLLAVAAVGFLCDRDEPAPAAPVP